MPVAEDGPTQRMVPVNQGKAVHVNCDQPENYIANMTFTNISHRVLRGITITAWEFQITEKVEDAEEVRIREWS